MATRASSSASPAAGSARGPAGGSAEGGGAAPRRGLFGRRRRPRTGPGRVAQIREVYRMTARVDPRVGLWVAGALLVPLVLGVVIGVLVGHPVYVGVIGLLVGVLAALFVLTRRAERAAYTQLEGQPGAAGAALRALRRGWTVGEEPVAVDPRTRDTVFRAVGRPGVVLTTDAPPHRAAKLLDAERRRVARVLPDVPLHLLQAGRGEGQVPLPKLPRTVMRLKPTLTKAEVEAVNKRLRALGGLRPPIPRGIDPMRARPDRKAVRGR